MYAIVQSYQIGPAHVLISFCFLFYLPNYVLQLNLISKDHASEISLAPVRVDSAELRFRRRCEGGLRKKKKSCVILKCHKEKLLRHNFLIARGNLCLTRHTFRKFRLGHMIM